MKYDVSAAAMLKMLGYDQPTGREWIEKLKQEKQISLPKAYTEFMELMADGPLLGTSSLWIGKMEHKTSAQIPCTFYEQLQEMIDDRKDRWSKRPGRYERSLYELFQLPAEEWPREVDNYLVIGSDYAGGMGEFGIRMEDLQQDDPPVYWHKDADSFSMWKLEHEKLSDFLLNVLIEALACVDYQSAESELKTKGWRYEEYFDLKKDDWVASKSVLKRHEKENGTDMKGKIMRHMVSLCWAAMAVLLLTGCNPTAGATEYEVIYSSGYSRDSYAYDEKSPIEGSSCYLQWEKADDYEKTYDYDIHILDENGSVLYRYPDVGSKAMRGSVQEDGKTWVCAEHWTAPHHNGYVEGWLKESDLLLMDLRDGEILFQDKAGENEFYITTYGTRCYFYFPGKEESGKLFGLIKIPAENAVIYYRDTSDWTQKHTVYTFDYVAEPDIDTSNGVLTRIKFYISENRLKVAWTSYEPVGDEHWEYLEKKAYEIPITE